MGGVGWQDETVAKESSLLVVVVVVVVVIVRLSDVYRCVTKPEILFEPIHNPHLAMKRYFPMKYF